MHAHPTHAYLLSLAREFLILRFLSSASSSSHISFSFSTMAASDTQRVYQRVDLTFLRCVLGNDLTCPRSSTSSTLAGCRKQRTVNGLECMSRYCHRPVRFHCLLSDSSAWPCVYLPHLARVPPRLAMPRNAAHVSKQMQWKRGVRSILPSCLLRTRS